MIVIGYEAFEAELTALNREHDNRIARACANTPMHIWPIVNHELTELRTHTEEALRTLLIQENTDV